MSHSPLSSQAPVYTQSLTFLSRADDSTSKTLVYDGNPTQSLPTYARLDDIAEAQQRGHLASNVAFDTAHVGAQFVGTPLSPRVEAGDFGCEYLHLQRF